MRCAVLCPIGMWNTRLKKSERKPKKPPTDEVVELEVVRIVDTDKFLAEDKERLDLDVKLVTWGIEERLDGCTGDDVVDGSSAA